MCRVFLRTVWMYAPLLICVATGEKVSDLLTGRFVFNLPRQSPSSCNPNIFETKSNSLNSKANTGSSIAKESFPKTNNTQQEFLPEIDKLTQLHTVVVAESSSPFHFRNSLRALSVGVCESFSISERRQSRVTGGVNLST